MINYKVYEKKVYDWLMEKHNADPKFTFSLRMKGSKGSELDYFIGTKKSNYFATTFWTIPVSFPGSSSDCIDLLFGSTGNLYEYHFEFTQTNSPQDKQNISVLNFLKTLKTSLIRDLNISYESSEETKMFKLKTSSRQEGVYDTLQTMLVDIEKDLNVITSAVNEAVSKEKERNPDFVAHRISLDEFSKMKSKLEKRFEKYAYVDKSPKNYWIFQVDPNKYKIINALKAGHVKSWKVDAHKDELQPEDKVIIWITGDNPGCYALAKVTSEVSVFEEEQFEKQYHIQTQNSTIAERVQILDEYYLAEKPTLWEEIKDLAEFRNFKAGGVGSIVKATKEEYEALEHRIKPENLFQKTRKKIKTQHFDDYITGLRSILKQFDLKPKDPRLVFSVRRDRLCFIIGQRYSLNVYTSKSKSNFSVISTKKLSAQVEEFSGHIQSSYLNYLEHLNLEKQDWKTVENAMRIELNRTKKSSFMKSNDVEFESFVFGQDSENKTNIQNSTATNKILYGPPGTGKTFYLRNELFDKYTSKQTSISEEQHFENVVSNCSWWQVIAIALLDLGASKVSNIFNHKWVVQKAKLSSSKTVRPTLWGQLQSHTINDCQYVNVSSRQQPLLFNKTEDSYWEILENEVKELAPELYELKDSVGNYNPNPDKIIENYDFVTFHQSFAYEDFIEGIKPILSENEEETSDLGYKIEDGVFKTLCKRAKHDPNNRYAIFIDEINRGNVSAIFGELITLIELDKRQGEKNEISIKLPYSKQEFSVPSNLDIYGTMNTADRSVEALDTALRRRFEFKEMLPDYAVIENEKVNAIQLSEVLNIINQRIELLIDRDHTIGHSYFVGVNTEEKLAKAFNNKIVPLLQDYFYGDYGKIGLVLGKGFIKREKNKELKFSSFKYEGKNEFVTPTFKLKSVNESNIEEAVNLLFETKES